MVARTSTANPYPEAGFFFGGRRMATRGGGAGFFAAFGFFGSRLLLL
jgi:hypothetical protein